MALLHRPVKPLAVSVLAAAAVLASAAPASAALRRAPTLTPTPTPTPAPAATPTPTPTIGEVSQASCDAVTTKQAFAAFGDLADYALAPGGSFEGSLDGWTLEKASVVSGNESVGILGGAKSLLIRDGGKAISPEFCLSPAHPTFRFVTVGGEVNLKINYRTLDRLYDVDDELAGETDNKSGKWQPSEIHPLATEIPASKLAKGVLARIELRADDDVRIDNLLIDPYRRG